jgi:hypothetical protein
MTAIALASLEPALVAMVCKDLVKSAMPSIKPLIFGDVETTIRSRSRDEDACRTRDYDKKNQERILHSLH